MPNIEEYDELLTQRRAVFIGGEVDEHLYEHLQPLLLRYALESADRVEIFIDSIGGDIRAGLRLYDLIRAMPGPTKGIVIGKCWSIALPILQACTERVAMPHSSFALHEVQCSLDDFSRSQRARLAFTMRNNLQCQRLIEHTLLTRSHLSLPWLRKLMREGERHEVELLASQALKMGLIDRIIIQPFGLATEE